MKTQRPPLTAAGLSGMAILADGCAADSSEDTNLRDGREPLMTLTPAGIAAKDAVNPYLTYRTGRKPGRTTPAAKPPRTYCSAWGNISYLPLHRPTVRAHTS